MKEFIVEYETEQLENSTMFYGGKIKHELIRCKDCIYYDGHYCHNKWWGDGYGNYTSPIKKEDGHCDWAERREE